MDVEYRSKQAPAVVSLLDMKPGEVFLGPGGNAYMRVEFEKNKDTYAVRLKDGVVLSLMSDYEVVPAKAIVNEGGNYA